MASWALGDTDGRRRALSTAEQPPPRRTRREEDADEATDDEMHEAEGAKGSKGKGKGKGKLRAEGCRLAALEELVVAMANSQRATDAEAKDFWGAMIRTAIVK